MATIYGSSSGGKKYTIGSQKGQDFVNNARPGSTLTGADGSSWTKNSDGSTTVTSEAIGDRLNVFRFVNGDLKRIRQRIVPFEGFADIQIRILHLRIQRILIFLLL